MPLNPYAKPFVKASSSAAATTGTAVDAHKSTINTAAVAPLRVFCDLDGCLVDFEKGCKSVTGKTPDKLHLKAMWSALARTKSFCEFYVSYLVFWGWGLLYQVQQYKYTGMTLCRFRVSLFFWYTLPFRLALFIDRFTAGLLRASIPVVYRHRQRECTFNRTWCFLSFPTAPSARQAPKDRPGASTYPTLIASGGTAAQPNRSSIHTAYIT